MNEWTAVVADQQTLGKGQRGKQWHSQFGKNLLMSVYVKPRAIKHDHQFLISAASGLAIIKTLGEYGIEGKLKWPNDVLVGGCQNLRIIDREPVGKKQFGMQHYRNWT